MTGIEATMSIDAKPVELIEKALLNSSKSGDTVPICVEVAAAR